MHLFSCYLKVSLIQNSRLCNNHCGLTQWSRCSIFNFELWSWDLPLTCGLDLQMISMALYFYDLVILWPCTFMVLHFYGLVLYQACTSKALYFHGHTFLGSCTSIALHFLWPCPFYGLESKWPWVMPYSVCLIAFNIEEHIKFWNSDSIATISPF